MNLVRQHTDYAFRLLVALSQAPGKPISTRTLASAADVPYQFASKIMQKLHEEGLVESVMGPFGGFRLVQPSEQVNLLKIIEAVQGPVVINSCLLGQEACPRSTICPIRTRLEALQTMMIDYLQSVSLADLTTGRLKASKNAKEKRKEGDKNERQKFAQSGNSGKSS